MAGFIIATEVSMLLQQAHKKRGQPAHATGSAELAFIVCKSQGRALAAALKQDHPPSFAMIPRITHALAVNPDMV